MNHLLLVLLLAAAPQPDAFTPLVDAGLVAREARDFASAEKTYQRLLALAREQKDTLWQFRAQFYLGLTKQEEAELDPTRARALREEAEDFYEEALKLKPDSTATMTNLADLEAAEGDQDDAIQWLKKALDVRDARYEDTAVRLAEIHASRNDLKNAARYFRLAAEQRPGNPAYHEAVVSLLLDPRNETPHALELADYLFTRLARHDVDRVIDSVFRALETPKLRADDAPQLFAVLAQALVQKDYDLAAFSASSTMEHLQRLDAARYSRPVADLKRLYFGDFNESTRFDAWLGDAPKGSKNPGPAEAFRELARSIGSRAARDRDFVRAERYFLLMQALSREADPVALRELAGVYVAERRLDKLDAMVAEYAMPLAKQQKKARWYELNEYQRYFFYISSVYASLPESDPRRVTASQAIAQAGQMNAIWKAYPTTFSSRPDHRTFSAIATRYEARGDRQNACFARVMGADAFVSAGMPGDARQLLVPVELSACSAEDRDRFAVVLDELVVIPHTLDAAVVEQIQQKLLVLSTPDVDGAHQRVLGELEALGVQVNLGTRELAVATPDGVRRLEYALPAGSKKPDVRPR